MRQIHIPWCTLTQTIRDISTLAWAGIVKQFACSIKQGIYVINVWCFITDKQCLQVSQFGGPAEWDPNQDFNSAYKQCLQEYQFGVPPEWTPNQESWLPFKKVNFRGLKSGNRFQFFSWLTKHVENVFFAKNGISFGQVLPREHHL